VLTNRNVANEMMARATGQSVEKLRADMNRCLYLNAQVGLMRGEGVFAG
jgi:ATP-dependent Clp protease protease subunit